MLPLFVNTFTAVHMYSAKGREKMRQQVELQSKTISQISIAFLKST